MRARLVALLILIALIGIPAGAYYYFTAKKVSSITVSFGTGSVFSLKMVGAFGLQLLPLADKVLSYQKECQDECTISPIIPANYTLTLTSTGNVTITDSFEVKTGEYVSKTYARVSDITTKNLGTIDEQIPESQNTIPSDMVTIGTDADGKVWGIKKEGSITQIGILSPERFVPYKTYQYPINIARLDLSRTFVLVSMSQGTTTIFSTDLRQETELALPIDEIVAIRGGVKLNIRTRTAVYDIKSGIPEENIRFSDYIDISPEIRIGYIDKSDTKKLSLSNYEPGKSVIVRTSLSNSEPPHTLRTGVDIQAFIWKHGVPAYIDAHNTLYTIE